MKLTPRQVGGFLKNDWQKYPIIVLFGHADDVMRQHQKTLLNTANIDTKNAFGYLHLSGEQITQDTSLLLTEASSSSLTGEQRWITVRGKVSELDKAVSKLCQPETQKRIAQNKLLIIIEELTTKAALLKKLTQCEFAAALPCYETDQHTLIQYIQQFCEQRRISCSVDGETALLIQAENNVDTLNQLLEKLELYLPENGNINQATVLACSDDARQHNLQEFAVIAFQGNAIETSKRLQSLIEQKINELAIVRILANHCLKLLRLLSQAQQKGVDGAIKSAQPPIFFKQSRFFADQCHRFSVEQLQEILEQLIEIEIQQKSGNQQNDTILRQWLLRLTKKS